MLRTLTREVDQADILQERRMEQIVNSSRSMQTLGEQSSVYVPISNIPSRLPSYLSLDPTSPWHVGALQAIGVESMTISSRLRTSIGGRGTLQDLEDTINSTGKRRIAKFELSIADPEVLSDNAAKEAAQAEKSGSMTSQHTSDGDDGLGSFDIDVFTRDYRVLARRPGRKEHIFGRAESSRGDWDLTEDGGGRDPHDRFDQGPALQRYVVKTPDYGAHDALRDFGVPHRARHERGSSRSGAIAWDTGH
jgi:hypothetical protein